MGRKPKGEQLINVGPLCCCLTCGQVGLASGLARHLAYCRRPAPPQPASALRMEVSVRLSVERLLEMPAPQLRAVVQGVGEVLAAQSRNRG